MTSYSLSRGVAQAVYTVKKYITR